MGVFWEVWVNCPECGSRCRIQHKHESEYAGPIYEAPPGLLVELAEDHERFICGNCSIVAEAQVSVFPRLEWV